MLESLTSGLSLYFVILMSILAVIDFLTFFRKSHLNFKGILTGLGILGTFLGIFLALLPFDSTEIDNSIPKLLDGMKLAFGTSVFGMSLSVLLSIIQNFFPDRNLDSKENEIGKELCQIAANQKESHAHLSAIKEKNEETKKAIVNTNASQEEHLNSLKDLLNISIEAKKEALEVSKKDLDTSTLISEEIATLRIEEAKFFDDSRLSQLHIKDNLEQQFDAVRTDLKEALEKLSEGANKEIIEALEDVMKEFNTKLSEIVGDKFDSLKQACIDLIKWQENYKSSITEFESNLNKAIQGIDHSKSSLETISSYQENFLKLSQESKESIEAGRGLLEGNTNLAQELAVIMTKLKEAQIDLNNFPKEIADIKEEYAKLPEVMKNSHDAVYNDYAKLNDDMGKATTELNNALTNLTSEFSNNYREFLAQLDRLMLTNNR